MSSYSELKEQNKQLQERIKLALLGYNAGIYEWNMLDDSAYYADEWKAMLGYEDEILAAHLSTWANLVHPDDYDEIMQNVTNCIKNQEKTIEAVHRLKHKDGHWVWILGRGFIEYNNDKQAIKMVGIHTDITKRKENELQLRHQSQMIEQTHDSIISMDMSGKILTWNKGSELLFNYTEKETIGKNILIFQSDNMQIDFDQTVAYLLQNDEFHTETHFKKKNQKIIHIALSLSLFKNEADIPIGIIAYMQDITYKKQVEKELADSHYNLQQYLYAIDEIEIGLFVVNKDYTVRYMNNTMKKWFGDKTDQVCYSAVAKLDERCSYCKLEEVIHNNKKITYKPENPNGQKFEIFATSIKNADGSVSKMEVIRDITSEEKAKELLLKEKEVLSYQANYDSLTKLPNRTLFYDRLERALLKSEREKKELALFFIDLDYFKRQFKFKVQHL